MIFLPNSCVCGAGHSEVAFPVADWNFSNVSETANMLRCLSCGSLFPDKFPLEDAIPEAYKSYYTTTLDRNFLSRAKRALLRILQGSTGERHLPRHAAQVLDFGCGSGEWLAEIRSKRPRLTLSGSDITKPHYKSLPFNWIDGEDISLYRRRFDWITLSHVVEHLPDPRKTLKVLSDCLAPGGALWIATPNADSYLFKSLRGRARDADFPRHRQIFSKAALLNLMHELGLEGRLMPSPRANTVLNLASGLAARSRGPIDIEANVGIYSPAISTMKHLISDRDDRLASSPELIVIAHLQD